MPGEAAWICLWNISAGTLTTCPVRQIGADTPGTRELFKLRTEIQKSEALRCDAWICMVDPSIILLQRYEGKKVILHWTKTSKRLFMSTAVTVWKTSRSMTSEVTQTFSLTLPCSETFYYPSLVPGPLGSNYCTLMAGPITSRLIVWSLPYVQSVVMLIHLSILTGAQLLCAQDQTVFFQGIKVSRNYLKSN